MQRPTILKIAGVCGALAGAGYLGSHLPPAARGRWRAGMVVPPSLPPDLPGAEAEILKPDNRDNYELWFDLARKRRDAGQEERAKEAWEQSARLAANEIKQTNWPRPAFMQAWSYFKLGNLEEARAAAAVAESRYMANEQQAANRNADTFWYRLGWVRAIQGKQEPAREAWRRAATILEAKDPQWRAAETYYNIACYRALVGDRAAAIAALRNAAQNGYAELGSMEHDEDLELIRDDPAFKEITARLKNSTVIGGG